MQDHDRQAHDQFERGGLAEEFLYARTCTSETQRAEALKVWNIHFNYHRPHSAAEGQPPTSRLATGITNVVSSYKLASASVAAWAALDYALPFPGARHLNLRRLSTDIGGWP